MSPTMNTWFRKAGTIGGALVGGATGAGAGGLTGALGGAIAGVTSGHGLHGALKGAALGGLGGAALGGTAGAAVGGGMGYAGTSIGDKAIRIKRKLRKKVKLPALHPIGASLGRSPISFNTARQAIVGALKHGPIGMVPGLLPPKQVVDTGVRKLRKAGVKLRQAKIKKPPGSMPHAKAPIATNAWTEEARAKSLEVRRGKAGGKFLQTFENIHHVPGHHKDQASAYRQKAMQARRGGLLRSPNDPISEDYDAMAQLHEEQDLDNEYNRREAEFHHQVQLESQGKAHAGSGYYGKKATRITGYGLAGGVAGAVGGHLAGKAIGPVIGRVAGRVGAKAVGGAIGGTIGFGVGGPVGAAAGAAIGAGIGKAVAKPAGLAAGTVAGSLLGKATGVPGAGLAGGVAGHYATRFGGTKAVQAVGRVASKVPYAAAVGETAKVGGQLAGAVGQAAVQGASKLGAGAGLYGGMAIGEILGAATGATAGGVYGYKRGKHRAYQGHMKHALMQERKKEQHQMKITNPPALIAPN